MDPAANLLEATATRAAPKSANAARAPVGNSGTADVLELLLLVVVVLLTPLLPEEEELAWALELDDSMLEEVLEETLEEEDELLVELAAAVYAKLTTSETAAPSPPHGALMVNVPLVHAAFPPGWEV